MMFTNLKKQARQSLLAFSLLISFFAVSGYVSSNLPSSTTTNTEVLAANSVALKHGISYKRAFCSFYRIRLLNIQLSNNYYQRVLLHNKLTISRYHHLAQLFSAYKSAPDYQFMNIPRVSYPDAGLIG
ncbi:hypothetical protein [Mucilaginibacter sp.]|uniref:hypothetical protein n=1 Tax=Mucilaginibacter sp. TaxID=1882438 RepID=UPI0025D8C1BC|nr:hypothetical protein [Mucilaginibacter sp.]